MKDTVFDENWDILGQNIFKPYAPRSPFYSWMISMESHHKMTQNGTLYAKNLKSSVGIIKHTYFCIEKRVFKNIKPKMLNL